MTRVGGLLLVVVGACEQGGSVELTLAAPEGIEVAKVELYAALGDDRETVVKPALFPGPIATQWWVRDMRDTEHDVELMSDGSATFVYGRGGDEWLEGFVAVGFDLRDEPVAMTARLKPTEIPVNEVHQYTLPMTAFDSLPRFDKPVLNPGLQLWGPSSNPRACVQVDQVDGIGSDQATALIAHLENDLDCDGYTDGSPQECVEREYKGRKPFTSLDALHCAQKIDLPPTEQGVLLDGCVAGGGACVDGHGEDLQGCHRSSYCMNTKFCDTCTTLSCTTALLSSQTYLRCMWPYEADANNQIRFCPGTPKFSLRNIAPDLVCDTPMLLRDVVRPGWTGALGIGPSSTFYLDTSNASICEYKFSATGPVPFANGGARGDFAGYLAVGLSAPVKGRGLLLPFHVVGNPTGNYGCTNAPTCSIVEVVGDTLNACVRTPVEPNTTIAPP